MANWKHVLDIGEIYNNLHKNNIHLTEGARQIFIKLKALENVITEFEFLDIVNDWEDFSISNDVTVDDFDSLMERLYNFGDRDHILWVNTFNNVWIK